MMTEMECDIYERACIHYKKKYRMELSTPGLNHLGRPSGPKVIKEFWDDYFSGKPLYS